MSDNDSEFSERFDPDEPTAAQPPIILPAPGEQQTSEKPQQPLILPSLEEQQPSAMPQQQPPSRRRIRPEDMVRRQPSSLPSNPLARIGHLWKNDPAYRVLFIAISVVLLSSLTCFAIFASMVNQPSSSYNAPGNGTNTQQAVHAGSTSTSTSSSTSVATPTPTPTSIPTPEPTPTPVATPTPVTGVLTVQITSVPPEVRSGATVSVSITTSEANVPVQLSIAYSALPVTQQTPRQYTDSQGHATITWNVQRVPPGGTAEITAIAQDQQGQPVKSSPVTVTVTF